MTPAPPPDDLPTDWLVSALRATDAPTGPTHPGDEAFVQNVLRSLPPPTTPQPHAAATAPKAGGGMGRWRTAVLCIGLCGAALLTAPLWAESWAWATSGGAEAAWASGLGGVDPGLWLAWLVLLGLLAGWSWLLAGLAPALVLQAT
jgi:hypothetical protein